MEHLSPIQKEDIHPNILTDKMLEDLRIACGADQLLVLVSKDSTTHIETYGMCGHEVINAAKSVIDFGLNSLEEEESEEPVV